MEKSISEQSNTKIGLFDDFGGQDLDRALWNVRITGRTVNDEQQAYVDSSETIYITDQQDASDIQSGGILVIHPRYHPNYRTPQGKKFDFISGRIDTREKFEFRYGTAAARLKLPIGSGFWPAFWAMGKNKWPSTGEIDIMENTGEADWVSAGVHGPGYSGDEGLINYAYFREDDISRWHIYSVEWSPDQLLFKVDEKLIYRVTKDMVHFHGKWAFDNPKYLILNFAIGGIYPFKINAVVDPYYGLPSSTVELIKQGHAKLLVDWVKISSYSPAGDQ